MVAGRAKLGDTSLFGDSSSSSTSNLMGGAPIPPPQAAVKPNLDDVPLDTEVSTVL
jgi:hypothetical protein